MCTVRAEDRIRLLHRVEAAQAALKFVQGRQASELETNQMLLFAVVRAKAIFGEAASKVSVDLQLANPSIPWRAITGMRNRLVHAYFDVDTQTVWKTLQNEIPDVLKELSAMLSEDPA